MSVVPTAPRVFFQLPWSRLTYPGFSEQFERQDKLSGGYDRAWSRVPYLLPRPVSSTVL